jgi:hypothetical protein
MARFLLTHNVLIESQDQAVDGLRQLAASLPPELKWVNSWWIPDLSRMICEWEAPDLRSVQAALQPFQESAPVVEAHEVERIDPHWYD